MIVRPEMPADYAEIAAINARAFDEHTGEALIVALQRQRRAFDPELSLVAEIEGRVVGHALFSPQVIRLLGLDVPVVTLGPIAVEPPFQRQKIGAALIEAGHRSARAKGYTLSVLVGHPWYYPRFGYRQNVYGASSIEVAAADLARLVPLESRRPTERDVPALRSLWRHEEGNIDFAIDPGSDLLDWISPNPMVETRVYLREGEMVGYTRVNSGTPTAPGMFLARDHDSARQIAAQICSAAPSVTLPLHPYSASAGAFDPPTLNPWDAAMACPLAPGPFDDFYARLKAGQRLPGRVIWPVAFDFP